MPSSSQDVSAESVALSVVVPNFNHAQLLPRAIEHLLTQDRPPDEIILIDDASTDGSLDVAKELARKEPKIRLIARERNQGVVACMNQGLSLARGRYVCFAAADDWTEPHFFDLAVGILDRHPQAGMFCAEVRIVTPSGERIGVRPIVHPSEIARSFTPSDVQRLLRKIDQFVATSTAVFRRDLLLAAGGFDEGLEAMADTFAARRMALLHGFYFAPVVVSAFTVNPAGLSRTTAHSVEAVLDLLARARSRIESESIYPAGYAETFDRRWRFATCRIALAEMSDATDFIAAVGARNGLDRAALKVSTRLPGAFGRALTLGWLTLRLRPYSLTKIIGTAIRRTGS